MKRRLYLASGVVLCAIAVMVSYGSREAQHSVAANDDIQGRIVPAIRHLEQMRFGTIRVVSSTSELVVAKLTNGALDAAGPGMGKAADAEVELIRQGRENFEAGLDALRRLHRDRGGDSADHVDVQAISDARGRLMAQSGKIKELLELDAPASELAEAKEVFEALEMQALATIDVALVQAQREADARFSTLSDEITDLRNEIVVLGLTTAAMLLLYTAYVIHVLGREAQARREAEQLAADNAREVERRRRIEARLAAHQKMEALGTMVGGIAHSVNNFLMPVITLSKMLKQDAPEGSEMRDDLGRIQASGEKASKLLRDLLAFSHTGTVRTPGGCEVVGCVGRALALARAALPSSVTLQESLRLDQAWIPRDEADMDTILFNLIGNAVDAMPAGKGRIEVTLDQVAVDDGLADDVPVRLAPGRYVRLGVSDNGCGIAGDVLPHIFEPFFTTKAVGKGTGLGLSIAYSAVTQVGGDIAVSSEPGSGARFDVFLPLLDRRPDGGIAEQNTTGIRS